MDSHKVWRLLHLFFAFSFVGVLVLADWNGRAARASQNWAQRAVLFDIIHVSVRVVGLGSLLLLGILGNVLSTSLGYRMASDGWLRWVDGLWAATLAVMVVIVLPSASRLSSLARQAANGGSVEDYDASLRRWRIGNIALSLLYLALLGLMVFRWRS